MTYLYLSCFIPVVIGLYMKLRHKEIVWWEWAAGSAATFLTAGLMHWSFFAYQTSDTETLSGQITSVRQFSEWQEYYEEAVYKDVTTGSGKNQSTQRVFSRWESHRMWHSASWSAYSDIGTDHDIDQGTFKKLASQLGVTYPVEGDRRTGKHASRMVGGDPNDYVCKKTTNVIIAVNVPHTFTNRLKASKTVLSFAPVPKDAPVFPYPDSKDIFYSKRVLGSAADTVSIHDWDKLNAVLGPVYQVNLILVGFGDGDSMLAEWQKSKWLGGKKNDLVICYGKKWAKVFGWSTSDIFKRELESLILAGPVDSSLLTKIQQLFTTERYDRRNWHDFDYLSVHPSGKQWLLFFFVMVLTQVGLWYWFHHNDVKEPDNNLFQPRRSSYTDEKPPR